jgi:hypothetical protein
LRPSAGLNHISSNGNHRVAHWASFGVLSFLVALLGRNRSQRFIALAGVIALGVVIELLQHLIYLSPLETWDMRDDSYGAIAGFIVATLLVAINRDQSVE